MVRTGFRLARLTLTALCIIAACLALLCLASTGRAYAYLDEVPAGVTVSEGGSIPGMVPARSIHDAAFMFRYLQDPV